MLLLRGHNFGLYVGESYISPGFQFITVDVDEAGEPTFSEETFSKETIRTIEQGIYVDPESNAAVRIDNSNGFLSLVN